jgi:hypothetical protein
MPSVEKETVSRWISRLIRFFAEVTELPDFSWYKIPKRGNIYHKYHKLYEIALTVPNGRKIYQMAIKRPTPFIARSSKIYPNWDFWCENTCTNWQPCQVQKMRAARFSSDKDLSCAARALISCESTPSRHFRMQI